MTYRPDITACGNCGLPEDAHKWSSGVTRGDLEIFAALGGACTRFAVSDAAVVYQRHLARASRAPAIRPGRVGKRSALCERCGQRGHGKDKCPF